MVGDESQQLDESLLFVEEDLGFAALMFDEVATTVGQGEVAAGSFLDKSILLAQEPVAVGVSRIDGLLACGPDGACEVAVVIGKPLRDPLVRVGPVDGVLRCSTKLPERRLKPGDLRPRPAVPDIEDMTHLTIQGEQRRADTLLGVFHDRFRVIGRVIRQLAADSGLGCRLGRMNCTQAEDAGPYPNELALAAVALDVDGDNRVERVCRGPGGRRDQASAQDLVHQVLVVHGTELPQELDSGLA